VSKLIPIFDMSVRERDGLAMKRLIGEALREGGLYFFFRAQGKG